MYDVLFMSNLITTAFFGLAAWFIYKYSSLFPKIERYWSVISLGFVVIACGVFMRLFYDAGIIHASPLLVSLSGSVMLLVGFYRLYVSHKV